MAIIEQVAGKMPIERLAIKNSSLFLFRPPLSLQEKEAFYSRRSGCIGRYVDLYTRGATMPRLPVIDADEGGNDQDRNKQNIIEIMNIIGNV